MNITIHHRVYHVTVETDILMLVAAWETLHLYEGAQL
jgi:hypothetical protein